MRSPRLNRPISQALNETLDSSMHQQSIEFAAFRNGAPKRGHVAFNNESQNESLFQKGTSPNPNTRKGPDNGRSMPRLLDSTKIDEQVNLLKKDLKINDSISAFFSLVGLLFAFIEEEIFFGNGYKSDWRNYLLRSIVSGSSAILGALILRHYIFQLKILKAKNIVYQTTSLYNSGLMLKLIIEFIFSLLHTPPGVDIVIENHQLGNRFWVSLNAYIAAIMLLRLYVLFRLFDHFTFWTGHRASRVCKINGFQANPKFAIKAYLKHKAFLILGVGLLMSVFIFGAAVRLFEKPFIGKGSIFGFDSFWNSLWCMIVTMTTIGYGDIFPSTHFGRLGTILACVWGTFLLSLFVVALNNAAELTKEEGEAFGSLLKLELIESSLSTEAYELIQTFLRLRRLKNIGGSLKERFLMRMDLVNAASRYKIKRKGVIVERKSVEDILQEMQEDADYGVEEVINHLAPIKNITTTVETITENQNEINSKVYEMYNMSKKLSNLIKAMNQGQANHIKSIKDVKIDSELSDNRSKSSNLYGSPTSIGFGLVDSNTDTGFPSPILSRTQWRKDSSPKESYFY